MRKVSQIGLVLVAVFLVATMAAFALQIEGVTNFTGVHVQATSMATATPLLMVENDGVSRSFEVRNSSATPVFSVDNDGTVSQAGAAALTGGLDVTGILGLPATAYTLTGAQTITPTTTYYELAPATVLTATLAGGTAGDLLILASTVATNTVIVDTGATVGGGNITLAENDIAVFIKVDDTWAEIASPDNS